MTGLAVVRFDFESLKGYSGKYLLKNLCLSLALQAEEHSLCETFALDTGSPLTILRQSALERVAGCLADYDLPTVEISGYDGRKEDAQYIQDVQVTAGGSALLSLTRLVVSPSINKKPFSLLGTDALRLFDMAFDSQQGYALLTPKGVCSADEISQEYVDAAVHGAIAMLCGGDRKLLELDVGERTITQHLAKHLQRSFPGWDVDCEYNRLGDIHTVVAKSIPETRPEKTHGEEDPGMRSVFPDVIVHGRGNAKRNVLVIEVKKRKQPSHDEDRAKLQLYKQSLGYQYACFVVFETGVDGCLLSVEWIE